MKNYKLLVLLFIIFMPYTLLADNTVYVTEGGFKSIKFGGSDSKLGDDGQPQNASDTSADFFVTLNNNVLSGQSLQIRYQPGVTPLGRRRTLIITKDGNDDNVADGLENIFSSKYNMFYVLKGDSTSTWRSASSDSSGSIKIDYNLDITLGDLGAAAKKLATSKTIDLQEGESLKFCNVAVWFEKDSVKYVAYSNISSAELQEVQQGKTISFDIQANSEKNLEFRVKIGDNINFKTLDNFLNVSKSYAQVQKFDVPNTVKITTLGIGYQVNGKQAVSLHNINQVTFISGQQNVFSNLESIAIPSGVQTLDQLLEKLSDNQKELLEKGIYMSDLEKVGIPSGVNTLDQLLNTLDINQKELLKKVL